MERLVEGLWDCPNCKKVGIGGLTKSCPSCGHPQDKDTQFYLGSHKRVLEEKESMPYRNGSDWTCSFCGSLNNTNRIVCNNCGASKSDSSGTYFDNQNKRKSKEYKTYSYEEHDDFVDTTPIIAKQVEVHNIDQKEVKEEKVTTLNTVKNWFSWINPKVCGIIGGGLALLALIIFILMPRTYEAEVTGKTWTRDINIEKYVTVQENDWYVPDGGRVTFTNREIHYYDKVLDHYDTVSVQKSRQVQDGYDEHVSYSNNGNGTFTEHVSRTPRYRTEYYTEYEQRPVYRDEPVYRTKYYYDIERWIYSRTVTSEGTDNEPYWEEVILASNERESTRTEEYKLELTVDNKDPKKVKEYSKELAQTEWETYGIDESVPITVQAGIVTKINE